MHKCIQFIGLQYIFYAHSVAFTTTACLVYLPFVLSLPPYSHKAMLWYLYTHRFLFFSIVKFHLSHSVPHSDIYSYSYMYACKPNFVIIINRSLFAYRFSNEKLMPEFRFGVLVPCSPCHSLCTVWVYYSILFRTHLREKPRGKYIKPVEHQTHIMHFASSLIPAPIDSI